MSVYPTKILLAADGSPASDAALAAAVELCTKTGSELHLVLVGLISYWTQPDTLSPTQYQRLKQEAQTRLDAQVAKITALGGQVAEAHLKMGKTDVEVLKLADILKVGLIIIGNRSENSFERILLGNTAESVVRHAHCAVMVVRAPPAAVP